MESIFDAVWVQASHHGPETALAACIIAFLAIACVRLRTALAHSAVERANIVELIENLSEGIYRSTIDGRQISANRALVRLNGYDSEAEMLEAVLDIGIGWYVEPGRRDQFRAILSRDGHIEDFVSEIYRHKTRERIWISESARMVRDPKTGRPAYYEGSVREITETFARLKLEEQFRKLVSHVPGGLFQIAWDDGKLSVVYLSDGFCKLSGMPTDRHVSEQELFHRFVHPDDRDAYVECFRQSHIAMEPIDHEFRIAAADGQEKWLRLTARPECEGARVSWYGYVSDISIRKRQALEIEKLAYFDPLTRLPNRRLLLDRTAQAIARCEEDGSQGALFFIDLDNFKALNDTQGHDVGDAFLIQVAERLRSCVRHGDTVARMGGDEFVVILETLGHSEGEAASRAIVAANQILAALRTPFELGTIRHSASASLGVVVFDASERRVDELLKRADIAMYQAKSAGRDAAALFDRSWMDGEAERFSLMSELRRALADNTLELHFQPQIDRSGDVSGAEALLRWHHPQLGMVPPERFIPLAEQSGMVGDLCRFVVKTAVARLEAWARNPTTAGLTLSVNVSLRSFMSPGFVPYVETLVAAIDASRLTIEFTEHVMLSDEDVVAEKMRSLKRLGVRFSLDDFGTGYSSLARLKALPFDEIKIDGGFVADIETSDGDRALVRTILAMATTLGLESVAEHVATAGQEAFLHAFGCDRFQGFRYSAALEAKAFESLARMRLHRVASTVEDNIVRLSA